MATSNQENIYFLQAYYGCDHRPVRPIAGRIYCYYYNHLAHFKRRNLICFFVSWCKCDANFCNVGTRSKTHLTLFAFGKR